MVPKLATVRWTQRHSSPLPPFLPVLSPNPTHSGRPQLRGLHIAFLCVCGWSVSQMNKHMYVFLIAPFLTYTNNSILQPSALCFFPTE